MKNNPVVHFEIYADDPDKLRQFYTDMFDWTIEPVPDMDYAYIKTIDVDEQGMPMQAGGINGGLLKRPAEYTGRGWMNYVSVDSIDAAIERAQKLGAKVMKGKMPVPGMGWFAMLTDPQGNMFALWETEMETK